LTELIVATHAPFSALPQVRATFDTAGETNCCTGHVTDLHAVDPITNENVEVGHGVHRVLPSDPLNFPVAQAVHDCALVLSNPALHKYPTAAAAELESSGQSEQTPYPAAALNFPTLHAWH